MSEPWPFATTLDELVAEHEKKMTRRLPSERDIRKIAYSPDQLKSARLRLGWSIASTAAFCEVSPTTWRNWEKGRAVPNTHKTHIIRKIKEMGTLKPDLITPADVRLIRETFRYTLDSCSKSHHVAPSTWLRWERGQTPGPKHQTLLSESLELAKIILEKE